MMCLVFSMVGARILTHELTRITEIKTATLVSIVGLSPSFTQADRHTHTHVDTHTCLLVSSLAHFTNYSNYFQHDVSSFGASSTGAGGGEFRPPPSFLFHLTTISTMISDRCGGVAQWVPTRNYNNRIDHNVSSATLFPVFYSFFY